MPTRSERPRPVVDDLSRPFWEAAQRHQLVVQHCQDCGSFNHPPRPACDACQSQHLQFESVSGRGTIYSFSVMHQPNIAGFEDQIPYLNILVELEEQPLLFMVSNLPIAEREKVRIGARVEVYFDEIDTDLTLPQFQVV
jgi:uncharacterized OB-fold protein